MQKDEITIELSDTLKAFLKFFDNQLQRKVLEIDENVKSDKYFQQLNRVANSLEQYSKKEVGLFYVGFLGSYSSGKSSTINSLLSLWGSEKVRNVSNNPTDSHITLITNQNNVDSVFTFAKEGAIPIRTQTNFDNSFLDKIVLMDTPGSGDPNIIASIVRDSLPLCDLIIYNLNATAPFTEIDRPFLLAQQSKLKNIPILFILTRGDEYRIKDTEEISKNNFDNVKYNSDLTTIITRINEAINISEFNERDFILIDNKSQFNIDVLKEKILSHTVANDNNLIVLHNHKLNYFKNEITEIHNYFLELANNKIEKCKMFLEKANSNIEYFDNRIEVSKIKIKGICNEYTQRLERVKDGTKGYIDKNLDELKLTSIFKSSNELRFITDKYLEQLSNDSRNKAIKIITTIEQKSFEKILQIKQDISNVINFETLSIVTDEIDFSEEFDVDIRFPIDINLFVKEYVDQFDKLYKVNSHRLQSISNQINRSLKTMTPIDKVNENIIEFKKAAIEILDIYYDAIQMYNVAAFAFEVKNYISDLGLAKEFDKLEAVDLNKAKYNLIAEKELLQGCSIHLKDYENLVTDIHKQSDALQINLNNHLLKEIHEQIDYSQFSNKNTNEKIGNIKEFVQLTYESLFENVQNSLFSLQLKIQSLKKKQRQKYLFIGISSAVIGGLIYFIFIGIKDIQVPSTMLWVSISGITTSLISTGITRFFDKFKITKKEIISDFQTRMFDENSKLVESLFQTFKNKNILFQAELSKKIYDGWKLTFQELCNVLYTQKVAALDVRIQNEHDFLRKIIEDYKTGYLHFHKSVCNSLDDSINTVKIDKIAGEIKNDSIKPSFELLTLTLDEINSVKGEIELLKM